MRRFDNVLVCSHGGNADLALAHGAALASRAGASLKVLHGPPALEITHEVLRCCHDMVVRVDDDRQRRRFRETATIQLSRLCPCPLWIIPAPGVAGRDRLLAAVSLQQPDEDLDVEILETALVIAWLLDRELHVVHAWDAPGARMLAPRTSAEYLAQYVEETRQQHREQLATLMRRYAAIPRDRIHLCKGRPTTVIPGVAAELAADPIVMGTAARRGIKGLLVGNTAERVMRQTDHSVVIVKRRSFVSPAAGLPARARYLRSSRRRGDMAGSTRSPGDT